MGSIAASALKFIASENAIFANFLYSSNIDFDITFDWNKIESWLRYQIEGI